MSTPILRRGLCAADIAVGQALPSSVKRFSTVDLVAYGAATWDWHRLHYDADYARSVKLPNVIIDGQMFGGLFARQALDAFGPRAFVARLSLKMRAMAFAGDSLALTGEVTGVHAVDGHEVVVLAQRLKNGDTLVAEATTEVRLPR